MGGMGAAITPTRITLGGGAGSTTKRTAGPSSPDPAGKIQPLQPVVQHFHVFGNTPEVQRFNSEARVSGKRRGLP